MGEIEGWKWAKAMGGNGRKRWVKMGEIKR